jgi:hypothetical protein
MTPAASSRSKYAFEPGQVFIRDHPFTLVTENKGSDPETETERWRPGAWDTETISPEEVSQACNALGKVAFTVVSTHRPPGYQERVFFKREFTLPDGKRYAPGKLHNCIARKFAADILKFPFDFVIREL